jgi:hypothetical protein
LDHGLQDSARLRALPYLTEDYALWYTGVRGLLRHHDTVRTPGDESPSSTSAVQRKRVELVYSAPITVVVISAVVRDDRETASPEESAQANPNLNLKLELFLLEGQQQPNLHHQKLSRHFWSSGYFPTVLT